MASLGDTLLSVAGGMAQGYNEDVARRRQKELDMMERAQELAKMSKFRLIETQFNSDLSRQQSEYEMENSIETLGGRNSPDAISWYLQKKHGMTPEEAKIAVLNKHSVAKIPPTRDGGTNPMEYATAAIDAIMSGNKGNKKLAKRLPLVADSKYTFDPRLHEMDETAVAIANREGPFSSDEWENANTSFRTEEQERLLKEFEERQKKQPKLLTSISEKGIAAGLIDEETAEVSGESFTSFGDGAQSIADLKLTEAKDTYKDKGGKSLRLQYSPITNKYYRATAPGEPIVAVDTNDFSIEGNEMGQRDKDFIEMRGLRDRIEGGDELTTTDKERYTFLNSKHSDTMLGPIQKMEDGSEVQDVYVHNQFDGSITRLTEFYKQGSKPILTTSEQSRMAATWLDPIASDIRTSEVEKGAFEEEFANRYPNMDKADKNVIRMNAFVLAQHYLRDPSKKYRSEGVAYEKAFETIAQFYNPETKRIFVTALHERIQQLVGGDAVDAGFMEESNRLIQENPSSIEAKARKAAIKSGVTNSEGYRKFINDQRSRNRR
jgi:hypothetical protein